MLAFVLQGKNRSSDDDELLLAYTLPPFSPRSPPRLTHTRCSFQGGEWKHTPTEKNPHLHVRVTQDVCVKKNSPCPCPSGHMLCDDPSGNSDHNGGKFCHYGEFCPIGDCPTGKHKCGSHWSADDTTVDPPVRSKQLTPEVCINPGESCPCHPTNDVKCDGPTRFFLNAKTGGLEQGKGGGWCMSKVDAARRITDMANMANNAAGMTAATMPMQNLLPNGCDDQSNFAQCEEGTKHCPGRWSDWDPATKSNHRLTPDSCVVQGAPCPCGPNELSCTNSHVDTVAKKTHVHHYCYRGIACPVQCDWKTEQHCPGHWDMDGNQITADSCIPKGGDQTCPCHPTFDLTCPGPDVVKLGADGAKRRVAGRPFCMPNGAMQPTTSSLATSSAAAATCPPQAGVVCGEGLTHCPAQYDVDAAGVSTVMLEEHCIMAGTACPTYQPAPVWTPPATSAAGTNAGAAAGTAADPTVTVTHDVVTATTDPNVPVGTAVHGTPDGTFASPVAVPAGDTTLPANDQPAAGDSGPAGTPVAADADAAAIAATANVPAAMATADTAVAGSTTSP